MVIRSNLKLVGSMVEESVEGIPLTAHPHIVIEGGQLFRNNPRADTGSVADRDSDINLERWIRIHIKVKSRTRIRIKVKRWKHYRFIFGALECPNMGEKVNGRIRIRVKGRIRIRILIKVKSRIRIRNIDFGRYGFGSVSITPQSKAK